MNESLTFLSLASEWDSGHGGLSTFNRESCTALAELGHRVFCAVLGFTADEQARARRVGVELVVPERMPGIAPRAAMMFPFPGVTGVDVVIGHGHITGSEAHVQLRHHPSARHVHFVHTDPGAIEQHKKRDKEAMRRADEQISLASELCRLADLAVGVGPVLATAYAGYLNSRPKPVHCFLPGLFPRDSIDAVPPPSPMCLVFGRADDAELKGLELAAAAMGEVIEMDLFGDARFVVRGANDGEEAGLREKLNAAGGPKLRLFVLPYSPDRGHIVNGIRQASIVLMPSHEEGFGLSALEAISEGVPVLISQSSGLAKALTQHVGALAHDFVVDVRNGPRPFAQRIQNVLAEGSAAFERTRALRDAMAPKFSWLQSAREFVDAIRALPPPKAPVPPPTSSPGPSTGDALVKSFAKASAHVLKWQQTLRGGNEWIERPALARIMEHARHGGQGPLVLLGGPGSGKSALLSRAAHALVDEGTIVLAIKADRLPANLETTTDLAKELGLEAYGDVESALVAAAPLRNTVLIIDQLDALADLIDVETRRLDLLLDLIERIAKHEAIRVVVSCREFDFRHDVRLRRVEAEELKLDPPEPATIDAILTSRGIDPGRLMKRTRELLATPQALDVFLQITPAGRGEPELDTYQKLLDLLWKERLGERPNRAELEDAAATLADNMARREELWLSAEWISTVEGLPSRVLELKSAGILKEEDGRVAFEHQTLFEFARARSFLAKFGSLPAFVRERQHALFVRPILWTSLAYLRATDRTPYLDQLTDLWRDAELRAHLHRLLIDFVAQVESPDIREVDLLTSRLHEPQWTGFTLEAITDRPDWFAAIAGVHLPSLMRGELANRTTILLARAIAFAPDEVANLLEKWWLPDPARHRAIGVVLFYAPVWPKRIQAIALAMIRAGSLDRTGFDQLLQGAIILAPTAGPEFLAAELERRSASITRGADDEDEVRRRHHELLDEVNRIDLLVDVANADPHGFVAKIWPWVVSHVRAKADDDNLWYRHDFALGTSLEHGLRELPQALHESLCICAKEPGFVASFVSAWEGETSMTVHQFLVLVIEAGLPESASIALEYLLADPRRLNIGDMSSADGYSTRLIKKAVALWSDADRRRVEAAIEKSVAIRPADYKVEERRYAYDYNRRHRLRLMRSLGNRASVSVAKARIEEERRFSTVDETFDPRMREIKSHVTAEQMLQAKDDEILKLFEALSDDTDRHPSDRNFGGSRQASEQFASAAKQQPERFLKLLPKFKPGYSERPVLRALWALAETLSLETIEQTVVELLQMGFFASRDKRAQVAWSIERVVNREPKLTPSLRELLESWLSDAPDEPANPRKERDAAQATDATDALLGTHDEMGLPDGNYPILETLAIGFLNGPVADIDSWMRVLETHVQRREDVDVWRALGSDLHSVFAAGPERAGHFLDTLFLRFPEMRDSRAGVTLIARSIGRVPDATVVRWLADLQGGEWTRRHQAVGELLPWFATRRDAPPEIHERLARALSEGGDAVRLGIAHTAANLWHFPDRRDRATDILVALMPRATNAVAEAVMSTFRFEPPLLDDATRRLFAALGAHPQVIVSSNHYGFVEALRDLLPGGADIVAFTALSFTKVPLENNTYSLTQSAELIDIAMTLQRLGDPYKGYGLDLFEALLAQGAYGTRELLAELDPANPRTSGWAPRRIPRRARRPRRKLS